MTAGPAWSGLREHLARKLGTVLHPHNIASAGSDDAANRADTRTATPDPAATQAPPRQMLRFQFDEETAARPAQQPDAASAKQAAAAAQQVAKLRRQAAQHTFREPAKLAGIPEAIRPHLRRVVKCGACCCAARCAACLPSALHILSRALAWRRVVMCALWYCNAHRPHLSLQGKQVHNSHAQLVTTLPVLHRQAGVWANGASTTRRISAPRVQHVSQP